MRKYVIAHRKLILILVMSFVLMLLNKHDAKAANRTIAGNGTGGIYIDINSAPYSTMNYNNSAYTSVGCGWFASARVKELTGKGNVVRNGNGWKNHYSEYGFTFGQATPTGKALACYGNHVSVIESVNGNTMLVSEGGWGSGSDANGHCIIHYLQKGTVESARSGAFLGYVYLNVDFGSSVSGSGGTSQGITFSNMRTENITTDDAKISATINNPSGLKVNRVGVTVWDSTSNKAYKYEENCGLSKTSFNMWYNIKSDFCPGGLTESGWIFWTFWAEAGGVKYTSDSVDFHTVDATKPIITDIEVSNITSRGYDVSCQAYDNLCMGYVQFPTWTSANGQDDLVWHNATYSNGKYRYHVDISDHNNETGEYITHIYAYDNQGNCSSDSAGTIIVPAPRVAPQSIDLKVDPETQASAIITATVSPANAEISSVSWRSSNSNVIAVAIFPDNPLKARMVAQSAGDAKITVDLNNGECKKTITISVEVNDCSGNNGCSTDDNVENDNSEDVGDAVKADDKKNSTSETIRTNTEETTASHEEGETVEGNGYTYMIHDNYEVELISGKNISGDVVIPSTVVIDNASYAVTAIHKGAFKGNNKIRSVSIGTNVKSIGDEAFRNCNMLKSVRIGANVSRIGSKAFYNCKKLKSINIVSGSLSKVEKKAFHGVANKVKFNLPKSRFKKYKKIIKKAGSPKKAKFYKSY